MEGQAYLKRTEAHFGKDWRVEAEDVVVDLELKTITENREVFGAVVAKPCRMSVRSETKRLESSL